MDEAFSIQGTHVGLVDLLKLQTLAVDLKSIKTLRTRSKRAGDHRSTFRGQGREFIEMKHYQVGDDVRQIDWRLTAKKQSPYVKVMEEDRHIEQAIWLELSSSSYFGTAQCFKSVLACHWAAFLLWRFLTLKHPVRLFIRVGDLWQKEFSLAHLQQGASACQAITEAHAYLAEHFRTLEPATHSILSHWDGKPALWLISDFLMPSTTSIADQIEVASFSQLRLLQVVDSFDRVLPAVGALPVKNGERRGWINPAKGQQAVNHQKHFQQRMEALKNLAWRHDGVFFSYDNDQFSWSEVQAWPLLHS